jgi:DNA anti-recombination protein RmuC
MATDSADIREKLAALGQRRAQLDSDDKDLMDEVRAALAEAKQQHIPKAEAARLLQMHRTTIYRVYE